MNTSSIGVKYALNDWWTSLGLKGNRRQILAVDSNGVDVSLNIEGDFDRTTGALRGDCLPRLLYIIAPLDLRTCPNLTFSRPAILLRFIQTSRA